MSFWVKSAGLPPGLRSDFSGVTFQMQTNGISDQDDGTFITVTENRVSTALRSVKKKLTRNLED